MGELQLNRPLAVLHGALLPGRTVPAGQKEDQEIRLARALLAVREVLLDRDGDQQVRRQVHLFLLINTELGWKEQLHENDAFSALAGLLEPPLPPSMYYSLVYSSNLWPQAVEVLQYLEGQDLVTLGEGLLLHLLTTPPSPAHLPLLAAVCVACQDKGQAAAPLLRSALTNFAKTILSKDQGKEETKALGFATLLTLLNCFLGGQGMERERRQLFAFSPSSPGTEDKRDLAEEVDSLLVVLKTFLCGFSISDWMAMLELDSQTVLKFREYLPYWRGPHPPSNMQLLLGHLAWVLQDLLSTTTCSSKTEVVSMLASLACRYDRSVELGLEDRSLPGLLSLTSSGEDWQMEAAVDHLVKERLEEVLAPGSPHLAFLPTSLLAAHLPTLLSHILQPGREVSLEEQQLVARVLEHLKEEELVQLLNTLLDTQGRLAPPDLAQQFTLCINRAGVVGGGTREEVLRLGVLGGRGVAQLLVKEAQLHKGQVDTVASLVALLGPLFRQEEQGVPIIFTLVMELLAPGMEEQERSNVTSLFLALLRLEPSYGQLLLTATLQLLIQEQEQEQHTAFLASFLAAMLELPPCLAALSQPSCLEVGLVLASLLNSVSLVPCTNPAATSTRQSCLSGLSRLFTRKEVRAPLLACLSTDNQAFFSPPSTSSLLLLLHSCYWTSALPPLPLSPSQLKASLPLTLPLLLPREWDSLLPLLCQGEGGIQTALPLVSHSLLAVLPSLPVEGRRALLLSLTAQLTALAGRGEKQVVVQELCTLLQCHPGEVGEDASLLWACLHGVLSGGGEAGEEVLAWLCGAPRSEDRDTAVRILLQQGTEE